MKVQFVTGAGKSLRFEFDCADIKDVFVQMAPVQEIFEAGKACGACQSENVRVETRTHDANRFYSFRCTDCGAQLDLGQTRDGTRLFARRKDKDDNWLPDNGWYKWQGQRGGEESHQQPPPPPPARQQGNAYGQRR